MTKLDVTAVACNGTELTVTTTTGTAVLDVAAVLALVLGSKNATEREASSALALMQGPKGLVAQYTTEMIGQVWDQIWEGHEEVLHDTPEDGDIDDETWEDMKEVFNDLREGNVRIFRVMK